MAQRVQHGAGVLQRRDRFAAVTVDREHRAAAARGRVTRPVDEVAVAVGAFVEKSPTLRVVGRDDDLAPRHDEHEREQSKARPELAHESP